MAGLYEALSASPVASKGPAARLPQLHSVQQHVEASRCRSVIRERSLVPCCCHPPGDGQAFALHTARGPRQRGSTPAAAVPPSHQGTNFKYAARRAPYIEIIGVAAHPCRPYLAKQRTSLQQHFGEAFLNKISRRCSVARFCLLRAALLLRFFFGSPLPTFTLAKRSSPLCAVQDITSC